MNANIGQALNAYNRVAGTGGEGAAPRGEATAPGGSFGDMVGKALEGAVEASKQSEAVSAAAVAGQADLSDVVTAVTDAQMALETVVSVRDRVVQAYQEVMRMPI